MPTPQERTKALLEQLDIPSKEIKVYGSQIVITTRSQEAALKWRRALSPKVAKFKNMVQSTDIAKKQKGTVLKPTRVKVWRIGFVL